MKESVSGLIYNAISDSRLSISAREEAAKIAKLLKVPVAHVGTNDNFFTFTEDELQKAASTLSDKPVYINLLGVAEDDHADNSSMNSVGWSHDAWYDPNDKTLYANAEITEPNTVGKIERKDSRGRRELNFVSMSCDAVPICSVCGEDIRDCSHERGETYDGKVCSAVGKDVAFANFVLTNNPADREAELGEVAIENASLRKRGNKMPKGKMKHKAQEEPMDESPPENEEKKEASNEDMLSAIQSQLNGLQEDLDEKFTSLEGRIDALEAPAEPVEEVVEAPIEEAPAEEMEEEEIVEEEGVSSGAGDAPIENNDDQGEMPPKKLSPPDEPTDVTPAATQGGEQPTDVTQPTGGEVPTDAKPNVAAGEPDGSDIVNAPQPQGEEPMLKKLKIEKEYSAKAKQSATLAKENAKLKAENLILKRKEERRKMSEFARKKIELIKKGFREAASKASTIGELNLAIEVANKASVSTRRAKYSGSDIPKYVDSRGAKISEEASKEEKVSVDLSKKGGIFRALEQAAKADSKNKQR